MAADFQSVPPGEFSWVPWAVSSALFGALHYYQGWWGVFRTGLIGMILAVGVVVTGTVHAGEIRVDDRLLLTPSGLEARVRSLHAQTKEKPGRTPLGTLKLPKYRLSLRSTKLISRHPILTK